ncbi:sigma-70 family RNA polymerase sigma factor [Pimelobacter sp. 30-1]|uniref:sigma-70 family RNA polymerase sigma factor n=1 Tax=Pimelobacter sp. 30-1 TaxID=2004991 RepID=UPI001C040A9F|nr:sigma-70 family RNA polymerase sigma factor [Pimelobacter sp. 30-1]MBU2698898.1 hypothetical protein [Pimelobacter sp. 30-1]
MTSPLIDPVTDGDPALIARVRKGDADAYAILFRRHHRAATTLARRLAGHSHADDLVAEAFVKVYDALQRDLGPTISFRAYLFTAIRSTWSNTLRAERRYDLVDDFLAFQQNEALILDDDPDQRFDNRAVAHSFRSLPERWQAVLWYTAVEGLPQTEVALYLGIKANAVAALAFRAREGLRQAYLSAHINGAAGQATPDCAEWVPLLSAYARGAVNNSKKPALEAHLDDCVACTTALADLGDVNTRLGALLVPVVLGSWALELPEISTLWPGVAGPQVGVGAPMAGPSGGLSGWLSSKGVIAGIAATVTAGVVGAAVAVPILLDGSDSEPAAAAAAGSTSAAATHAQPVRVTSVDPTMGPATSTPTSEPSTEPSTGSTAGPVSPATSAPPTRPTGKPEPTTGPPPPISDDLGLDSVRARRDTAPAGQADLTLTFSNLRSGAILNMVLSRPVPPPTVLRAAGWRCESRSPDPSATVVGCEWTGADRLSGELVLRVVSTEAVPVDAEVSPPSGYLDTEAANNRASTTIPAAGP